MALWIISFHRCLPVQNNFIFVSVCPVVYLLIDLAIRSLFVENLSNASSSESLKYAHVSIHLSVCLSVHVGLRVNVYYCHIYLLNILGETYIFFRKCDKN